MSVSRPHSPAFVAGHDAPLIGERAATRGRSAMEGGDEHAGAKSAIRSRSSLANRIERREPRRVGGHSIAEDAVSTEPRCRGDISRPHPIAFVAAAAAPLIGERAARRGRIATEVAMSAPM